MTALPPGYRPATADDADQMATLVNIAGDGLPLYIWGKLAEPGRTAWDVGRERARRGLGGFAFANTVVRVAPEGIAACLIGYPHDASAALPNDDPPAPLRPLAELGALVPTGAWYLNVLATFPEHRGRGIATALLGMAETRAHASGCQRICLVVSDANTTARRLYARRGFQEQARRPIVKEAWRHAGAAWLLLAKELVAK